jgi:hypothetical protein
MSSVGMDIILQIQWLFLLALPVASVSWTITHEEILKEAKLFCVKYSKESRNIFVRKFFYLFTCEYCFSHYISILALLATGFKLLIHDWRGYIIAGFALVWVANCYMGLFQIIRLTIKKLQLHAKEIEVDLAEPREDNNLQSTLQNEKPASRPVH